MARHFSHRTRRNFGWCGMPAKGGAVTYDRRLVTCEDCTNLLRDGRPPIAPSATKSTLPSQTA